MVLDSIVAVHFDEMAADFDLTNMMDGEEVAFPAVVGVADWQQLGAVHSHKGSFSIVLRSTSCHRGCSGFHS